MFNNYTDEDIKYQCCSVIIPATGGNGPLLIGDFNSVTDSQKIKQHNIKTIITAAAGMQHLRIPSNTLHIVYPLLDANSQNIKRFFDQSTTMIKNSLKNGGVLVHCAAGISRSATLVIAYLIKTRKMNFKQAIQFIRNNRNVRPNLGFERQLKQYQKQILDFPQNKLLLKKTVTQKLSEQRRTNYNRSSHLQKIQNDIIKFQPRTAQQASRRKNQLVKRIPHSQSRPRDRKNFKVRPLGKQGFLVMGQAHGTKQLSIQESISVSQQIRPPLIQYHHKNAINNGWIKHQIKNKY